MGAVGGRRSIGLERLIKLVVIGMDHVTMLRAKQAVGIVISLGNICWVCPTSIEESVGELYILS